MMRQKAIHMNTMDKIEKVLLSKSIPIWENVMLVFATLYLVITLLYHSF